MIDIKKISFKYNKGNYILEKFSAIIPNGSNYAILGESGSGKTTLLKCIGQFLKPQTGTINYNGKNIFEINEQKYRESIGIVFQKLFLFPHLTVLENLTLALINVQKKNKKDAIDQASSTLKKLGLHDLGTSFPDQISGGQAQRVAVARALLLKPEYLLLDEPTSALDNNTTNSFAKWLQGLEKETNLIIVTHDQMFAQKVASTGIYLQNGQVLAEGKIETIIQESNSDGSKK